MTESANNVQGNGQPGVPEAEQPDGKAADVNPIETQLAELQKQASDFREGWQRERAEFANYRKRAEKERDEIFQNAAVETLRKLLPVIDDFERATATLPAEKAEDEIIKGFSLIHRKLVTLLEGQGVRAIDPQGKPFDPAFHEAIGQDETTAVPSGHVTAVLQKGYMYGERVLRPALVRVAG